MLRKGSENEAQIRGVYRITEGNVCALWGVGTRKWKNHSGGRELYKNNCLVFSRRPADRVY